ncbi:50S ribosomal protein L25 [Gemmata sp.]|uniref:50S ribosomal protein L25 n=1 Tax=Gemmata sp. TaxID=1914242 RepID=UPI003F6E7C91
MSQSITLKATPRTGTGSRAAVKLRKQGLVPGVVYGHKKDTASVSVSAEELDRAIRVLHVRMLDLEVDGTPETVLVREVQWDAFGKQMIHVDFERKSRTDRVKVTVPVELRNAPKATGGGVLDQPLHKLHIECLLGSIPEAIRIDITNLTLGNPIHVRELTLPEGVQVLEAPEAVVVQLKLPGVEAEPVAADTGAGPEVIKPEKKKADEEAEEKKK